ncbi:MAG TPA: CHAD domain-containing protein, partial [Xanthobacteraceae bacterium]
MHGPAARLSVNRANREAAGLQPGLPLAEGLLRFGRDILADAREAFDDPQKSGSAAVHDFRKAMKRWRAFLRVLQPAFGAEVRRPRIAARDLARRLSAARDAQSALDALADLTKAEAPPPARSLATITARLQALRTGVETSTLTDAARAEVAAALASAETTLAELALQDVTFAHFADGLGASYARARAAVPDNWLTADTDALHELRTRVVVHRYQMDLVEPLWPRLGRLWVAEAQRLRDRLGTCQDLAVL